MAKVSFNDVTISAIVTTIGNHKVDIEDEQNKYGFDDKTLNRLKKTIGFGSRYIVGDGICASDLCCQSAVTLFDNIDLKKDEIDGLIFVTQSPDYRAPSTAIIMQDRLGLSIDTVAYDINLGCSGFVYGLFNGFAFINCGFRKVLLLVGDVSNYFTKKDKTFTPLMGDAGSAVLIEKGGGNKSCFVLHSNGSGYKHLIIPAGGARMECSEETLKLVERDDGSLRRECDLYMNGAEVFNFAVKTVPGLIEELFESSNISKNEVDYFVLHQANYYILKNIASKLGVSENKVPMETAKVYGNQNSASIPGTINGYLSNEYSEKLLRSVFAGFGIGLSWAACYVTTDNIFAPVVRKFNNVL
jgi:3-oxoacyl-[acyl-carrier-protein] synthase-3